MRGHKTRTLPHRGTPRGSLRIWRTGDHLSTPILLAAIPITGCLFGWFLDQRLGTFPWLTLLLLGLGFIGAARELWLVVKRLNMRDSSSDETKI